MKPVLIFPPGWTPFSPYLALPVLKGYLENKGVEVFIWDINVDFYEYILSKDYLKRCYLICEERFNAMNESCLCKDKDRYIKYSKGILFNRVAEEIEEAKLISRSEEYYDKSAKDKALSIISNAFFLINLANENKINISFNEISIIGVKESTKDVIKVIEDKNRNLFIDYYESIFIDKIIEENIDFVGISVTSKNQLIPALTLANLIKKKCRVVKHIALGGNFITRLAVDFEKKHVFFDYVDSMIVYEGEEALYQLIQAVENNFDLSEIPNLCYIHEDNLIKNKIESIKCNEIPIPDFQGLPLEKYFSSKLVMPLYSSRCCYNNCAFCTVPYGNSGNYRTISIDKVYAMMDDLSARHKTNVFAFVDETFDGKRMVELAKKIIKNKKEFYWYCETRVTTALTDEACKTLYRSGCRKIQFGLESYNQNVLDKMKKNISIEDIQPCLENCIKNGIAVHLFFMLGFPSEKREEAIKTIEFTKDIIYKSYHEYNNKFSTRGFGGFALEKHSHVCDHPEEYNITIISNGEEDLKLQYKYAANEGLTREEAINLTEQFKGQKDMLKEWGYMNFFNHQVPMLSDENLFLQLINHENINADENIKTKHKIKEFHEECKLSINKWTSYRKFKFDILNTDNQICENIVLYNSEKNKIIKVKISFLKIIEAINKESITMSNIKNKYGDNYNKELENLIFYGFIDIEHQGFEEKYELRKFEFNEDITVIDDTNSDVKYLYNYVSGDIMRVKSLAFKFIGSLIADEIDISMFSNRDIVKNLILKSARRNVLFLEMTDVLDEL